MGAIRRARKMRGVAFGSAKMSAQQANAIPATGQTIRLRIVGAGRSLNFMESNEESSECCIKDYFKPVCGYCTKENLKLVSDICLYLGFVSIIASIATWFTASRENRACGERFGIFIGLWVPSFFILSNRLSRKADELFDDAAGKN